MKCICTCSLVINNNIEKYVKVEMLGMGPGEDILIYHPFLNGHSGTNSNLKKFHIKLEPKHTNHCFWINKRFLVLASENEDVEIEE